VIASTVAPTVIANAVFLPRHLLGRAPAAEKPAVEPASEAV
jgi:hypothetical protein